jgi:hypothetical protein
MSGEAMAIGGNIVKGVGSFFAGQSNAKALRAASREELIAGAAQEAQIREVARKAIGEQVAGQFSNGFQGGTGTALDALQESAVNAAIDAMRVRREASMRAANLRKQGQQAATQSWFDLASGLMGAGSAAYGMKADWAAARQGQTPSAGSYGGRAGPITDGSGMTGGLDRLGGAG